MNKKGWIVRYALKHSGEWTIKDIARAVSYRKGELCSPGYVKRALREAEQEGKIILA